MIPDTDTSRISASPLKIIRDGVEYVLPILTRKQVFALLDKWASEDRAALLAILKEAGASDSVKVDRMTELLDKTRLLSYAYRCLYDRGRADEAIMTSMRTHIPTIGEDAFERLGLAHEELLEVGARVMGLDASLMRRTGESGNERPQNPSQ